MYSRQLGDRIYTFEPSGGLLHASLVMMDRETDSHWSILSETAIWGPAQGTQLEQIPGAVKVTWGEWKQNHPQTLVLSIGDKEHQEKNYYEGYFASEEGFRKLSTPDLRLRDKQLVYAFHWQGKPVAVSHGSFVDGAVFSLGDRELFLYRHKDDPGSRSSRAYLSQPGTRFVRRQGSWQTQPGAARWDAEARRFDGEDPDGAELFQGFDTYWYSWSLINESSEILEPG